jgi:O-antigen ligase
MYQGLVEGSNMFGSMMAMCSPFLLWQTYRYWKNTRKRIFWMTLLSVNFFFLLAAVSRGAILVALCTALGLFLCLGTTRRTHILVLFFGVILGSFLLVPGQFEQFQNKYLHKLAATEEQGVLHTREMVWKESYEQAKKGGWLGGGYGVTIGDTDFKGGFTTIGYGREKGNTQLAIIEETGLIGLAIYLAALIALFTKLGRTALRLPKGPEKVLLSIVTGNLFGMTIMSVFEAWWVAPSSPESVYFWALAGVALGLARIKPAPARLTHQAGKVPTRRMVPSSSSRRTASA